MSVHDSVASAVGAAVHNGWAIFVTVCASKGLPVVIDRRRRALVEPGVPDQPYHHEGLVLELAEADALIRRVRASVVATARTVLSELQTDLKPTHAIMGLALPESRPIPADLAEVLATKAVYIADRELYVSSLGEAARSLGIPFQAYPRDGEFEFAAQATGLDPGVLMDFVISRRTVLGAPWQKDHRAAAATAVGLLASIGPLRLA